MKKLLKKYMDQYKESKRKEEQQERKSLPLEQKLKKFIVGMEGPMSRSVINLVEHMMVMGKTQDPRGRDKTILSGPTETKWIYDRRCGLFSWNLRSEDNIWKGGTHPL